MSLLLFIIGGIAVMVGAATVAFGIPINEFSFGNTLIVSGSTVGTGGLVIIAIAAAVSRLNRIAEAIAQRPEAFPHEALEPPPEEASGRLPFPPRTRPLAPAMPSSFEPPLGAESAAEEAAAPALPNPEAPPLPEEAALPLHGEPPPIPPPPSFAPPERPSAPPPPLPEPAFEPPWRKREAAAGSNFDAMWPQQPSRPPPDAHAELEPEPGPEPAAEAPPPPPLPPPAERPRAVAVLKSGVVDGMGYTLYVDGSIEAELPQGTLRFASIDELRAHLEKGS